MALCSRNCLLDAEKTRFFELVSDEKVQINHAAAYTYNTALLSLCRHNQSDSLYPCLKALLGRPSIYVNAVNRNNNTALIFLCRYCNHQMLIECIQLLIDSGIKVQSADSKGRTALMFLCQYYLGDDLTDIIRLFVINSHLVESNEKALFILLKRGYTKDSDIVRLLSVDLVIERNVTTQYNTIDVGSLS